MTLEEMGALLRQERERQGISLEKAAADIKISRKYLIALEDGRTDELPHPVYAKGFVKNYARLLGLDSEEMGRVLSDHYAVEDDQLRDMPRYEGRENGPAIKERKAATFAKANPNARGFKPALVYAVPVLLVAAGLAWFFFFSGMGRNFSLDAVLDLVKAKMEAQGPAAPEPPKQAKPAPPRTEPSAPPAHKAEAQPEPKKEPVSPPVSAEPAAPIQRDLLATGSGPAQPASQHQPQQAESALSPDKLAAEAQFASSGRQVVEINANQPAAVDVSAEDGQRRVFTLVKGQRLSLRFNDKVVVRFQQAPSVSVKLNGKDYPLEGGKADGKSITFP